MRRAPGTASALRRGFRLPECPRVTLTTVVVAVGTPAAIATHVLLGAVLGLGYPWSTFLFKASDRFADYYNVYEHARTFHLGASGTVVYTPLAHLLVTVLTAAPAVVGFVLVAGLFLLTLVAVLWCWATRQVANRTLRALHVAVLTVFSYPVLFVLDRGNLEIAVFVFLAAFFYLYYSRRSSWAWLPLGLAIGVKYYWAVLLVLLLLDRRYRQAVFAGVWALGATAVGAVVLGFTSGYGTAGVFQALGRTLASETSKGGSLFYVQHGHSLWGALLMLNRVVNQFASRQIYLRELYLVLMLLLFALVVVRLSRRPHSDWQKATVLVMCALLFPYQNSDYTLVQWILVFALFAAADPAGWRGKVMALLFGVTMIPIAYYYFPFIEQPDVGLSVLAYPAALLATGLLALTDEAPDLEPALATVARGWRLSRGSPRAVP